MKYDAVAAEIWAGLWRDESGAEWVWPTVEIWAYDKLVEAGHEPQLGEAHSLTWSLLKAGRDLGWWRWSLEIRRWKKSEKPLDTASQ